MNEKLLNILRIELKILEDAAKTVHRSYEICKSISLIKPSIEDLDHLEALTSRFARLSDLIVQKILRLIDQLDLESQGTPRDRIHRAEKKGLISSSEVFVNIRLLRNEIAHEYLPEEIQRIFQNVIKWCPEILDCVSRVQKYCQRYQ